MKNSFSLLVLGTALSLTYLAMSFYVWPYAVSSVIKSEGMAFGYKIIFALSFAMLPVIISNISSKLSVQILVGAILGAVLGLISTCVVAVWSSGYSYYLKSIESGSLYELILLHVAISLVLGGWLFGAGAGLATGIHFRIRSHP
ncbi:hypothetical protein [Xanthomonas cucurbitae]|uniref:Uncharacterized protein n=1 Tax=Xanthomonas cucurbitae TaxID=56453 RepID=A0ABY7YCY4_9XANT|nr:hypothetical protein [Xanthomonas cucurbitae]WDM67787.1 hypothetical protein K6981_00085 [Xanthomonas cucurbitae]WDM71662.1 hypothetical protein K6978_00085 [Xanthomonas cucurbitae]